MRHALGDLEARYNMKNQARMMEDQSQMMKRQAQMADRQAEMTIRMGKSLDQGNRMQKAIHSIEVFLVTVYSAHLVQIIFEELHKPVELSVVLLAAVIGGALTYWYIRSHDKHSEMPDPTGLTAQGGRGGAS
ncbi:MAG: hypothetical protein ACRD16_05675 [Thermoanaerobaculia bacterium]